MQDQILSLVLDVRFNHLEMSRFLMSFVVQNLTISQSFSQAMSRLWHLEFELHNEQIHDQSDKCRKKYPLTSMLNKVE